MTKMKLFSSQPTKQLNSLLKISIFLLAFLLAIVVQHVSSQTTANSTMDKDQQKPQNDFQLKAKAAPTGRAGRMLDLDRLAGDVGKSAASAKEASVSGNRQSRSGEFVEERSKKGNKKMKINGFIPIVSMEGATHLSGLTGGSSSDDNEDSSEENEPQQQQQQSNLREHLATSYGGQTSIGHASFPSSQAQQPSQISTGGGEQQWQQVDSQPQVFSASSLNEPNQVDGARANRKLLGTSNIFSSLTGQPKRGLVSSLLPSGSLSLGGQAGGYGNYPQATHAQGQLIAGPMNVPLQSTLMEQQGAAGECICVPFFQCKNGYLSESQLSKSQLSQLGQLGLQVPRSSPTSGQANDLNYNQRPQAQQQQQQQQLFQSQPQYDITNGASQSIDTAAVNQQQVMNDIYEQLRKNMESGQLDQQMQSAGLIDERNAVKVNSSNGETEERSLFNSLANRRSYQTAQRSCGIMRTCCKVPPRMTGASHLAHLSAARFVNPAGHLHQQLVASPSVSRPQMGQYQNQQQLAHRYLQTRPSRMNNPQMNSGGAQLQASDFYPPTNQNHQLANQLDSSYQQQASQLSTVGLSQPMVMESAMQQQQQQHQPSQQLQTALVSRPPAGSFMSGRCGIRQTLGIAGRVQNAPVVQGLEPGESSADFGEFPAHAAILKRISPGDSLFVCSAVLISSQWLATAAHCVRKHRPEELKVRLGEWDVNRDDEFYPFFETNVREIVLNPDFQSTSLANDLALIRLEQPVDGQQMPHVAPACLAQPEEQPGYGGQRCWVAGWGKNAFGQQGAFQSVLKKVDLPVVSHADCELALKYQTKLGKFFRLHANNICAGGERGKDACEGDGGAGLYCLDPQSQLIKAVGLVSWGVGCGQRGVPGVYVNLANFNSWIENVVVSSGEENVYALMDGRMNANGSPDFKNIISERTNDKTGNGTLAATQEQQEGRSMGSARAANETSPAITTSTTSTTSTSTGTTTVAP